MSQHPMTCRLIDALTPITDVRLLPKGGEPAQVIEIRMPRSVYNNFGRLFCEQLDVDPALVAFMSLSVRQDSTPLDYTHILTDGADFFFHIDLVNASDEQRPEFLLIDHALIANYDEYRMSALQTMLHDADTWLDQAIVVLLIEETK